MNILGNLVDFFIGDKLEKALSLEAELNLNRKTALQLKSNYDETKSLFNHNLSEIGSQIELCKSEFQVSSLRSIKGRIEAKKNNLEREFAKSIVELTTRNSRLMKSLDSLTSDPEIQKAISEKEEKNKYGEAYETILAAYQQNKLDKETFKNKRKEAESKLGSKVAYSDMIVQDPLGRILLLKRAVGDDTFAEKWGLPGGHVDPGEEHKEAAIRECDEESGIAVDQSVSKVAELDNDKAHIEYYRTYSPVFPIVIINTREHSDYEWVSPEDLENYDLIGDLFDTLGKVYPQQDNEVITINKAFITVVEGYCNNQLNQETLLKYTASYFEKSEKQGSDKVDFVMGEFKEGRLKDRNGSVVTDRKQAIAIALSEAGLSRGEEEVEDEEESDVKKSINTIIKALETGKLQFDLIKAQVHKYIRREGAPGNWKYIYEEPKQKEEKVIESNDSKFKGEVTKEKPEKIKSLEKKLGKEFKLFEKTGSVYGTYNGIEIRLSNHPSKFNEKNAERGVKSLDLNYEVLSVEDMVNRIKDVDPFEGLKIGEEVVHRMKDKVGKLTYLNHNKKEEWVEVLNEKGEKKKYFSDMFTFDKNSESISEEEREKNFKEWFGDSKVVDSEGNPLIVYHGTDKDFSEFDKKKRGSRTDEGMLGKAFYFGTEKTASSYGDKVIPVYLKMNNPLKITEFKTKEELAEHLKIDPDILTIGGTGIKALMSYTGIFSDAIKDAGYDGVITKFEYAVFEPNQIKSANKNSGEFDPNSNDINKAFLGIGKKKSGIYEDNAENRSLHRVGQKYSKEGKGEEPKESKSPKTEDGENKDTQSEKPIYEHAKQASGSALEITAKEATDPEVRTAAHQELDRRSKEEAVQPEGEKKGDEVKVEPKEEKVENKYLQMFRTLSDGQVKFYLDAPYLEVKEAAKMVVDERGLSVVSKEDYIKSFEDYNDFNKAFDVYNPERKEVSKYLDDEKNIDQRIALNTYVGYGFKAVRFYLSDPSTFDSRHKEFVSTGKKLTSMSEEDIKKTSDSLSTFIGNNKIDRNLTLNRRVLTGGTFFTKLKEGDIYEDKSFSSTSLTEQDKFGDFNIKILAKKGSKVSNVDNMGEYEYLIDKGSKFRVINKNDKGLTVELL